jgi:hypothetical protein
MLASEVKHDSWNELLFKTMAYLQIVGRDAHIQRPEIADVGQERPGGGNRTWRKALRNQW